MFGVRIIAFIDTDKYYEFFQSVGSLSPEKPISFFHVNEDLKDSRLLNITAECNSMEPLKAYLHTDRFKMLMSAIDVLGSLEDVRLEKYSAAPENKKMQ